MRDEWQKDRGLRICTVLVVIAAVVALALLGTQGGTEVPTLNRFIYAYYPPAWEFCISARSIVQSDGSYESNLVGGSRSYPIPDTDYMQQAGAERHVCLPGNRYDSYYFLGTTYVGGSGCLKQFATENGGRFALLHMDCRYNASPSFAVPNPAPASPGPILTFADGAKTLEDETYKDVPIVRNRGVALVYHGGHYVGWSRWPSSYAFSFGSCWDDFSCASDAHLCVVYDGLAAQWFRLVELGQDHHAPKPKPKRKATFPAKRFGNRVPAYYHHHLTNTALFWWHHTYFGKALTQSYHRGHLGFHRTTFAHHVILCWDNGRCRAR